MRIRLLYAYFAYSLGGIVMRRWAGIGAVLLLMGIFAVSNSGRVHSSEGAVDDRELAQVFGGGESTGCALTPDTTTCCGVLKSERARLSLRLNGSGPA